MNKPCQITLVGIGDGNIAVFINGEPQETVFFCESSLDNRLLLLLEKHLTKYVQDDELPF